MKRSNGSFDLLAIGNLTLDRIHKVDRVPGIEETALILHSKTYFGGRAANVAFTSARLGANAALVSTTGRKFIESGYRDFLVQNGINIDKVKVTRQPTCASIELFYTGKSDMVYFFHPLTYGSSLPLDLSEDDLRNCEILYLTSFDGEKLTERMFSMVKDAKTVVATIGEEVYRRSVRFLERAIDAADYLFLNQREFELLMKRASLSNIREFFSRYARLNCLAVTMGHLGSALYTRRVSYKISPVIPQRIVNSLGSGDAYAAGFIYGLLKRYPLEKCGKIASVVASFVLEEEGAQSRKINIDKVHERYDEFFGDLLQ